MVYDSTLCYKNSERSQIQGIAKGFLDDIALATVEEQKLFKFTRTWNSIWTIRHGSIT